MSVISSLKNYFFGSSINESVEQYPRFQQESIPFNNYAADANELIGSTDRTTLLSKSRFVYENVPLIRYAVNDIASYAVKDSWLPVFNSGDPEWNKLAAEKIVNWFYICSVMGFDMWDVLKIISKEIDVSGDILLQFTFAKDGSFPLIHLIEAHNIGNPDDAPENYKDGVIVNKNQRPIAYYVLNNKKEERLTTQEATLLFEPKSYTQYRGISSLSSGLRDVLDYRTIKDAEKEGIKAASKYALIEENQAGMAPPGLMPRSGSYGNNSKIYMQEMGMIRYIKSGQGSKLTQLENNRPGDNTQNFIKEHVVRSMLASLEWPLEMFDLNGMNGANTRAVIHKAEFKIRSRQNTLYKAWKSIVRYAVARFIENGELPANVNWWRVEPTYPSRLSIDLGRDINGEINQLKVCGNSLTNILGKAGEDFDNILDQRITEVEKIMARCKEKNIPYQLIYSLFPNMQTPPEPEQKQEEQEEQKQ